MFLVGLSGFEIDGVVDGDRDLSGDALHEDDFGIGDSVRSVVAETQSAEAVKGGGERQDDDGADARLLQVADEVGIAGFGKDIERDEGFLILPNPAGGRGIDGQLLGVFYLRGVARFKDVKSHGITDRIVKDEGEEIEGQHRVETLRKFMEKGFEITVLGDGAADVEKGLELAAGVLNGRDRLRG